MFERLLSKPKLLESRKSEYSGFYKMAMVSNFPTGSGGNYKLYGRVCFYQVK